MSMNPDGNETHVTPQSLAQVLNEVFGVDFPDARIEPQPVQDAFADLVGIMLLLDLTAVRPDSYWPLTDTDKWGEPWFPEEGDPTPF
jgi:hypothetical protein